MRKIACLLAVLFILIYSHAQTGSLEPGFGTGGVVTTPIGLGADEGRNLAIQPDGKIVVVGHSFNGTDYDFAVVRYNTDGTPDNSFGGDGIITTNISAGNDDAFGVAIQTDGKIVVAGTAGTGNNDFAVVRYNTDGTLDGSFDGDGIATTDITGLLSDDHGACVVIQSDGKIIVAGYRNAGSNGDFALVRYNTGGSTDGGFGGGDGIVITDLNGSSEDFASGVALQSDGKIVVAGSSGGGSAYDFALIRYNIDGTPDNSFGSGDGVTITSIGGDDHCNAIAIQNDGKIVLAGWADVGGDDDFAAVRYNTDGTTDNSFDGDGMVTTNLGPGATGDQAWGIALQSGGKILLAGNNVNGDFNIVRYNSNGNLDNTFDSDGKVSADLASGQTDEVRKLKLYSNRIYVTGFVSMGGNHDLALAAFQNDGSPLPLRLTHFSAQQRNSEVVLHWQTEMEQDVAQFIIERSQDGKKYSSIGSLPPLPASALQKKYTFTDAHLLPAINYYRLLIRDTDGKVQYSRVLIIKTNNLNAAIRLFPNPASGLLQVQLPAGMQGKISLQITDAAGKIVRVMTIASSGYAISTSFDISGLQQGAYLLRVDGANPKIAASFIKD